MLWDISADQLPVVPHNITDSSTAIHIGDSREGWAEGLRQLLRGLYAGTLRPFDTSDVRPEGAILQTFGGLASGPAPLHELHAFAEKVFREARGRRLTPLECHDLVCKIGESVVVGGVRRCVLSIVAFFFVNVLYIENSCIEKGLNFKL